MLATCEASGSKVVATCRLALSRNTQVCAGRFTRIRGRLLRQTEFTHPFDQLLDVGKWRFNQVLGDEPRLRLVRANHV